MKTEYGQRSESLIFLLTNVKKSGIRVAYPEERFYAPPASYWGEGRGRLPGKECISYLDMIEKAVWRRRYGFLTAQEEIDSSQLVSRGAIKIDKTNYYHSIEEPELKGHRLNGITARFAFTSNHATSISCRR